MTSGRKVILTSVTTALNHEKRKTTTEDDVPEFVSGGCRSRRISVVYCLVVWCSDASIGIEIILALHVELIANTRLDSEYSYRPLRNMVITSSTSCPPLLILSAEEQDQRRPQPYRELSPTPISPASHRNQFRISLDPNSL
jgi:hypothetical protein